MKVFKKMIYTRKIRCRICPRCGGTGTFNSGEVCYYCNGSGTVSD